MLNNQPVSMLQKHRKALMLGSAVAVLLVFALYNSVKVFSCPKPGVSAKLTSIVFLMGAIMGCILLVGCYFWISRKKVSVEKFFVAMMLIFGVAYMLIFLPFTIPDEQVHYLSSYRVSNYFLLNFEQAGTEKLFIRDVDYDFFYEIRSNVLSADYYASIRRNFTLFSDSNALSLVSASFVKNAPLGYVASGLGIAIGRLLHLGAIPTFYLGRLANLGLYTLMVWWAIKRIPYGKMTMLTISALPMALHIIASYSYDFFIIAISMLFISQILYMREKVGNITIGDIILCAVWGIMLAPSKLVYFPILLTVFLIPSKKFNMSTKKAFLLKSAIVIIGLLTLFLTQFTKISANIGTGQCLWTDAPLYSVSYALSHPLNTIRMFADTLIEKGDFFLTSMVGSYMAWLQIVVPFFFCLPMLLIVPFSSLRKEGDDRIISIPSKLWVSIIGIGTSLLVMLSMLFSWTPVTATVIEGIQGRYFLPVLPFLPLLLRCKGITRPKNTDNYILFFVVFYNLFMCMTYFGYSFI